MRSEIGLACVCVFAIVGCGGDSTTTDGGTDASTDSQTPDVGTKDSAGDVVADGPDCSAAPTNTFYVNAATGSDSNKGGSAACAFKTITAAITASASTPNSSIDVAAGTYSAGETFPLVVDKGRSIIGAGASSTTIQGASTATYNTTGTNSFLDTGTHFVTLVAGDVIGGTNSLTAATISGVTILPPSTVTTPTANYLGIVCIAGNGPNTGSTPPLPAANLVMKNLTVGPNFDTAIAIGSSPTQQTGCNASIITSTITGSNVGIGTGVCGGANPTTSWPSAQVGDGQIADANTFTATAIGVFGEGCGSVNSFNANKFTSGYRGIVLVSQAAQYFEILSNTFDGTAAPAMGIGVDTNTGAVIAKLNDNTFTNISESNAADTAAGGTTGYAIALSGNILQAQRNNINNNDNGLYVGTSNATFDFSYDSQTANRNQFSCNSKAAGNGYDVILAYTGGSAANLAGNAWDHAPPSTSLSTTTSTNGTDIVTGTALLPTTTNYEAAITTACSAGRSH